MRYPNNTVLKTNEGKRYVDTTIYPTIEPNENDSFITTQLGDRLDVIANKFYGKVSLWWILALANNLGKGTLSVPVGTELRIPFNVPKIVSDLNKLNDIR